MPGPQPRYTAGFLLKLEPQDLAALEAWAKAQGVTRQEAARLAIRRLAKSKAKMARKGGRKRATGKRR